MSLNNTPSSERIHIGIFGKRNSGKSSLINTIAGQSLAIVSEVAGTTTDPVYKTMEILPLGPTVLIDTAGLDDEGTLGAMRAEKAYQVLNKTDIAIICVDINNGVSSLEKEIIKTVKAKEIPFVVVRNKLDTAICVNPEFENDICVSAKTGENINALRELLGTLAKPQNERRLIGDLLRPDDIVVLVVPIDSAAPKGRLILPQQQTIRDVLESGAAAFVTRETELTDTLASLSKKPRLVVTDSQAFQKVSEATPEDIPLTSFSILFSRYKGDLKVMSDGAKSLNNLKEGDTVLISEGCTHHRQCEDIGTVKLPKWISGYTKKELNFEFTSGGEFPGDLSRYSLIVHCGACMLNEKEVAYRIESAQRAGIPITNYGILIAYIHGILERAVKLFNI
ncbi:MAG: [FeFe] hydrogenase H-cluster maturation GTPase HydF [Clostridiaceae bacterium]|nr:[FeFe] hydrogenase H-cluster maturation GTPase HydF [Clostridiaceae bacterium]